MPSIQEAWKTHRFSIAQAVDIITAYINPDRPEDAFPWNKDGLIATPCLIGEAGIGKTSIVRQVARRLGLEHRDSQVGARAFEDMLGIPGREEDPNNPGHHKVMAPPGFPSDLPLNGHHMKVINEDGSIGWESCKENDKGAQFFSGYGVYFHDEVGTADPDKQNQIRDMMENRRVGPMEMAPNWFQVAATNPPVKGYVTVKRMDRAVEDRLMFIPVEPRFHEVMGHWEANNMLPDSLYKYLLKNGADGFTGTPDNPLGSRRWVLAGDMIETLDRAGSDEDVIFDAMVANVGATHAGDYRSFREFGNDQTKYPLRAGDFLTDATAARSIEIMQGWKTVNEAALAGASVLALRSWVVAAKNEEKLVLTDNNLDTLAKLVSQEVIPIEHATSIINVISGSSYGPKLVDFMFKNGVTLDLMDKITEASSIAMGSLNKGKKGK